MHYLACIYAILFVAWSGWEISDLRRFRSPWWLLAVECIWKVLLWGLMAMYITGQDTAEQVHPFLRVAIPLVVGIEVTLRVFSWRHDEFDLGLSEADNRLAVRSALVITGPLLAPASYMRVATTAQT